MAKCHLTLELDQSADEPLVPGQLLTGHVRVDVDKDVRCRKLTVDLFWRTHGSGNQATGNLQRLVLFEGEWKAGEKLVYDFELQVPSGPQTYHGHLLNVDWFVNANADIPWAIDPSDETDVLYDGRQQETYDHGPSFRPGFESTLGTLGTIFQTLFGLFFMGFASIFLFVGVFIASDLSFLGLLFACFPLPFIAVGGWMVFTAWRSRVAEKLLGSVDVEVVADPRPGEPLDVLVHCEPLRSLTLNGLHLALVGREVVVRGSGTNRTTYRHELYREEITLDQGRTLAAGEQALFAHSFQLPDDAPPAFAASDNALHWEVEIQFDLPRWPDWVKTYQLGVRP